MSYTELESGYQGLKQNRPGFYVGHDGNLIALVSDLLIYNCVNVQDSINLPTFIGSLVVENNCKHTEQFCEQNIFVDCRTFFIHPQV